MPKDPKHQTETKSGVDQSSKAITKAVVAPSKWTQIEQSFIIPEYAKGALNTLDRAGHVAYIVGGSVRDHLLKLDAKDHDIATSAKPEELIRLFPNSLTVGRQFGVVKIPVEPNEADDRLLEIATFRDDGEYLDHRHPSKVEFGDAAKDSLRRDFTVNALYFDPKTNRILDGVNGISDLNAKIIRAIGDPKKRFNEDALRLLRAIRFAVQLSFKIEPATLKAIQNLAGLVTKVSHERVRDEISKMMISSDPERAFSLLKETGLLLEILPELSEFSKNRWAQVLNVLNHLSEAGTNALETCWAALLQPLSQSPKHLRTALNRFRLSSAQIDRIELLVLEQPVFKDVFQMRESTLQKWIRKPHFEDLLKYHEAHARSTNGNLAYHDFCATKHREIMNSPLSHGKFIDGEDLIQMGLKPGPKFSKILETIEDLALEKKIKSKAEAMEFILKHFVD